MLTELRKQYGDDAIRLFVLQTDVIPFTISAFTAIPASYAYYDTGNGVVILCYSSLSITWFMRYMLSRSHISFHLYQYISILSMLMHYFSDMFLNLTQSTFSEEHRQIMILKIFVLDQFFMYCLIPLRWRLFGLTWHAANSALLYNQFSKFVSISIFCCFIVGSVSTAIETGYKATFTTFQHGQETEKMKTQAKADERLNHVVKGKIGQALSWMEIMDEDNFDACKTSVQKILIQCRSWVKKRQIFTDIASGQYMPCRMDVCLNNIVDFSAVDNYTLPSHLHFGCVDAAVLELVYEEMLSNALKYKIKSTPISLFITFDRASSRLRMCMENLTPQRVDVSEIGDRRCKKRTSFTSDGIGVQHVYAVVAAVGGSFGIYGYANADGNYVCSAVAELPAIQQQYDNDATVTTGDTPNDKHVFVLDDDAFARLATGAFLKAKGFVPYVMGEDKAEQNQFVDFVLQHNASKKIVIVDKNIDDPITGHPHLDGLDVAKTLRSKGFTGPIFMVTGSSDADIDIARKNAELTGVYGKDFPEQLIVAISGTGSQHAGNYWRTE